MAQSLGQELRHPPDPVTLADMVAHHSFDDRSQPGTDVRHSGLNKRRQPGGGATHEMRADAQGGAAAAATAAAQTSSRIGRCVSFDEAPLYLRREFILTGYYIGGTHVASVWQTLFGWNNETLNAWTMFLGLAVALSAWLYARVAFPQHWLPFALMAASAVPHAPFSIALHTTIGVSEATRDRLRTLDVFFILTCGVPRGLALAWFVFSSWTAYAVYTAAIVADWAWSVGSTCVFRRIKDIPKPQLARDVSSIVLCYTSPMVVAAARETYSQGWPGLQTAFTVAVVALLYLAAWLYSRHLPERWRPGAYDIVGNSHQWMHLLVVIEYGLECVFLMYQANLAT